MSDSPSGHLEDGLPPDIEQLGRIETADKPVHIRLQRVPREDGVNIWQISAASVATIPDLFAQYGHGLHRELLPRVFLETEFLDTQLWQWLALPLLIALGYGLGLLVTTLGFRLLQRWRRDGGKRMAASYEIPFLGEIPLVRALRESGDEGRPIVISDPASEP